MGKRWVPLESNPDVLNTFAKAIGAPCSLWSFCDVYGMDEVTTYHLLLTLRETGCGQAWDEVSTHALRSLSFAQITCDILDMARPMLHELPTPPAGMCACMIGERTCAQA